MCFLYIFLGGGRNFICLPEAQSWPGTALDPDHPLKQHHAPNHKTVEI